ncbi:CheR family methyltransferase [Bradyrhizobium sp.]|uniref:CheR family methyltransferase n=1 Tax=Bradyrhizobium sp. TaxID=376 RepID=UPI003BAFEA5E
MTPEYKYLRMYLKEHSGFDLAAEKRYLIESRLLPLARQAGLPGISELVQKMKDGSRVLNDRVVEAMTINETFFFRDKTPFDHFRDLIMPQMLRARANRRRIRIWCAAGSTGQEPYSLAMSMKEMGAALAGWRIEIIATDLSQGALEKSKAGLYSQFEVQRGLPIQMLLKYFKQAGELWQINADIRAMVQHRQLNLLHDFSELGVFDLIFCRNVLIYFDQQTKTNVLNRFAQAIEADGFLMLGAAETVFGLTNVFKPMAERRSVYQLNEVRAASVRTSAFVTPAPAVTAMAGI